MKKKIKAALILLFLLAGVVVTGLAQDNNDVNNGDSGTEVNGGPNPPNDVPIDGGLSLLLAAGAFYGVKKYREHRKLVSIPA